MENLSQNKMVNRSGKVWAGLFIIVIGLVLLLDNIGLNLPHWLFNWSTILMGIGLFVGARKDFKGTGWFIMVLIGAFFTAEDIFKQFDFENVVFPIALVILGAFLILKSNNPLKRRKRWQANEDINASYENTTSFAQDPQAPSGDSTKGFNANDYVDSVNVFGGSNQVIYSKNLKGGEVTAVFGGGDINLTQADFEGVVVLDVTAIFGGVKIIVPANWEVKSEVTAIFGGVDDKRALYPPVEGQPKKLIIIKGIALFGGVEFKSF